MRRATENEFETYLDGRLDGDEILVRGRAANGAFAITSRRLLVASRNTLALDVAFGKIRHIQFDLELGRSASIAFVSNDPRDEPVLLNVPAEEYAAVADALVTIGRQLAALDHEVSQPVGDNRPTG